MKRLLFTHLFYKDKRLNISTKDRSGVFFSNRNEITKKTPGNSNFIQS